jgi:tetratricopeptide (TPR) repeat protein
VSTAQTNECRQAWGIGVLLVLGVFAVFGQTAWFGFMNYDDDLYVSDNPVVQKGLTWAGVQWALTYGGIGHWHPLTWLTHMLDCEVYGLWAGGHHLTNVALHAAATVLLFLVLRRMTGALWPSALVAAVFAIHPLRAESVAWIAERKDVLSAVFFMLTLGAYARYVQTPTRMRSLTVCVVFLLGLLSKNMLVTVPFVLLLLDYWPLGRMGLPAAGSGPEVKAGQKIPLLRLVQEKAPLFVLTAGSCMITLLVPEEGGDKLAWGLRMENAVVSTVIYLRQLVWPTGLAASYPPPKALPGAEVIGAALLLAAITVAAWVLRRKRPYLIVGWLWYLGMLVPVIGIVQISYYAHADRYTYLPQIGLLVALVWGAVELATKWRVRPAVLGTVAAGLLVALGVRAWNQVAYWQDGETLWRHTLACTTDNAVANYNLADAIGQDGRAAEAMGYLLTTLKIDPNFANADVNLGGLLLQEGRTTQAMACFSHALWLDPDNAKAHNDAGDALQKTGHPKAAVAELQRALEIKPDYANAHYNLGNALFDLGQYETAITQYKLALDLKPSLEEADYNLGNTLMALGRMDEAVPYYRKALALKPDKIEVHNNLGGALMNLGDFAEAIKEFRLAVELQPTNASAANNLAWLLATLPDEKMRNGSEALRLAQQARQLIGDNNPLVLRTLAAAYAETGQYDLATQNARLAIPLAEAEGSPALADELQRELAVYEQGKAFRMDTGAGEQEGR